MAGGGDPPWMHLMLSEVLSIFDGRVSLTICLVQTWLQISLQCHQILVHLWMDAPPYGDFPGGEAFDAGAMPDTWEPGPMTDMGRHQKDPPPGDRTRTRWTSSSRWIWTVTDQPPPPPGDMGPGPDGTNGTSSRSRRRTSWDLLQDQGDHLQVIWQVDQKTDQWDHLQVIWDQGPPPDEPGPNGWTRRTNGTTSR